MKLCLAGASSRALGMFVRPGIEEYSEHVQYVGVYDINPGRSRYIGEKFNIPVYENFDAMLRESGADTVLVTTVDAFHHRFIVDSLMAGCDVVTEKPMTIDAEKALEILDAEKKSGKKLTVTFNYRYMPFATKIRELIASGVIGDVYSVHFEWLLDRNMDIYAHGTSYFRRWNRYMGKSGGLLVHKSTHHFDLVNWWLADKPNTVTAFGELRRYGKNGPFRGKNCRNCDHTKECEYFYDISKKEFEMDFYVAAEGSDGYYKDGCVYAEDIDIYDTMSVLVKYGGGTLLTYSLNAHTPYEGWRVSFNGSKGRLEAFLPETGQLSAAETHQIKVFDSANNVTTYDLPAMKLGHGGGDANILRAVFVGDLPDPMGHQAGSEAGVNSIIVGVAANISIREKRVVEIDSLLSKDK